MNYQVQPCNIPRRRQRWLSSHRIHINTYVSNQQDAGESSLWYSSISITYCMYVSSIAPSSVFPKRRHIPHSDRGNVETVWFTWMVKWVPDREKLYQYINVSEKILISLVTKGTQFANPRESYRHSAGGSFGHGRIRSGSGPGFFLKCRFLDRLLTPINPPTSPLPYLFSCVSFQLPCHLCITHK